MILLSEVTHAQDAAVSAEKILLTLSAPHRIDQHDLHLTASIGIATYPDDGTDAETLMKNADFAMYHAKDSGRNNYQFFKPKMNVRALERQSLEIDLRHALERAGICIALPAQNESGDGRDHRRRGAHPLASSAARTRAACAFIPIAEECGFIVPIGQWVLREACRQARAWQDAGLPPMRIAINISAVELRAKDFVAGVRAILTETGLEPRYLELELTETFLMQDSTSTAAVLQDLKELGVQLALDDFGTGYSSLSHLKRFPIDTLKIDQSFVRDVATDADDASIVSAVISMGKSLHMRVVAEGVETRSSSHSCGNRLPRGTRLLFQPARDSRGIHAIPRTLCLRIRAGAGLVR